MRRAALIGLLFATAVDAQEVVREQRSSSPWPAVTIVTFVDASPHEAAAVFIDYGQHHEFVPGTKLSRVSRIISPSEVEVDYVVALPIVSDEEYTVRDKLSRDSAGGYRVDWILVRASSTKGTIGHARFTPATDPRTGKSGTRFEYHNFVTPGSRLSGLGFIRNRALREMEETARALARRFESERRNTAAMRARIASLRASLGE